jgi:hypothetical protein
MAEEDEHDDQDYDEIRRDEIEHMDDLGEDESDEEESDNDDDDDEEDESEDIIESEEEEKEEINYETVHKFIRTFRNGDFDAEFDDALSSDRSAVVPDSRPTQASYNKPDNWRERNRIGLEGVKESLQNCIDSMSHGKSLSLCLLHNVSDQQLVDNEEPIVWHEPILDEYWGRLEAEIDRVRQLGIVTEIESIFTENVEIKKERLDALVDIFRSGRATKPSMTLIFNNTNLCGSRHPH